jgi:hypothetical protein
MSHEAFAYKSKVELKQMSLLDLNVYIAELRRRSAWLRGGPALKSVQEHLEEAVKARDAKRARA